MAAPRFYCAGDISPGLFVLPPDAAHHASRVLRLQSGEEIILFNGKNAEYAATVKEISKSQTLVEVLSEKKISRESPLELVLVQSLLSAEKMDWVMQKSVELGAKAIQVVQSSRSVSRLGGDRVRKREEHWRQVVISACEQCGRNSVPEILPLDSLEHWLSGERSGFILSPAGKSLGENSKPSGRIHLLIGPEGGLSDDEEKLAVSRGLSPLSLGPRIFRTETAGLAAISAMQALWGDF